MLTILKGNIFIYNIKHIKNMSTANQQLTSVKVDKDLFELFRLECIKRKFSFQKLAERTMHLYLTDDDFRKRIHNHADLNLDELK